MLLRDLDVIVLDCQATASAPRGQLIEMGWARLSRKSMPARAHLIAPANGQRIPPAVARITGISDAMMHRAIDARTAWTALLREASAVAQQPAPTIVHYARFEEPFLRALAGMAGPPLDLVCTHEIARRLLPDLPRRSLRALAGFFGRSVAAPRRSADHVEATAFVWQELVRLLEAEDVATWIALKAWLASPYRPPRPPRRAWPMPREVRLAVPDAPGVYRMLRGTGDVLYVGKAASLRHRVNSYFRKQHGIHERTLEMLAQARNLSYEVTPTALEAALLECDEIKRHRPPYNVALAADHRELWFASRHLLERSTRPSPKYALGPFPSAEPLDEFSTLTGGDAGAAARLLRLGTRLWREGRRDRLDESDEFTARRLPLFADPSQQEHALVERVALRAALARRRARWLTRMMDACVVWAEPGSTDARIIVFENGEIASHGPFDPAASAPIPPGATRTARARHDAFTVARFDRLRVVTTEMKRLVGEGGRVAVRFGTSRPLAGARLSSVLAWV